MAHLLVTNETVIIDQENVLSENRSIGKHKRGGHGDVGLTFLEGSVWSGPDVTKRRALVSITNQPNKTMTNSNKSYFSDFQKKTVFAKPNMSSSMLQPPMQLNLLHDSTSFLSCDEEIKPIGSEMSFSASESRMSLSVAMSSSFKSISFESPMHISSSSPDVFAPKLQLKECLGMDLVEDNTTREYAAEIFTYLKETEVSFHPNPHYMKKQPDISEGMRCILVDWLVEVAEEFKLDQHTLYMSAAIMDRFLSNISILRSKLQLVGATTMYIASKFEEIFPPEIADFTYITDDTYTKAQIVQMERLILKILDFNLGAPTTHTFLLRYLKANEVDLLPSSGVPSSYVSSGKANSDSQAISQTISYLSMYLSELALQDADPYLKYYPSVIAASAVCLSRHTLGQTAWPRILEHCSGYSVFDISNCVQDLHRTLALAPHHAQQAIRQKYSTRAFDAISTIKAPETLPC